jgi:hypothetical protein
VRPELPCYSFPVRPQAWKTLGSFPAGWGRRGSWGEGLGAWPQRQVCRLGVPGHPRRGETPSPQASLKGKVSPFPCSVINPNKEVGTGKGPWGWGGSADQGLGLDSKGPAQATRPLERDFMGSLRAVATEFSLIAVLEGLSPWAVLGIPRRELGPGARVAHWCGRTIQPKGLGVHSPPGPQISRFSL